MNKNDDEARKLEFSSNAQDPRGARGLPRIVWEDSHLLIVDKPANMLSVPGRGEDKQFCLARWVQDRFPEALIVHRLDMATSGLLVLGRGAEAQRLLSALFRRREIDKRYEAVLWGGLSACQGEVELPLLVDWPRRPRQAVNFQNGKPSLTRFSLLRYEQSATGSPLSRVELEPITGRSHQLRVHMLAIGHPILGDEFYGCAQSQTGAARLLLHARYLAFSHPFTGRRLEFESPVPF